MRESLLSRIDNRLQALKQIPPKEFVCVPPPNRILKRIPTNLFALAVCDDGTEHKCIVENLSNGGAGISTASIDKLPVEFTLAIDGYEAPTRVRLVWRGSSVGGVEFMKDIRN